MRNINYITFMVKRSFWLCFLFPGMACGNADSEAAAKSRTANAEAAATSSASVTIQQNGITIASYQCKNPGAILEPGHILIELNSPDSQYTFMGYIGGSHSGNYNLSQNRQQGKAAISVYNAPDSIPSSLTAVGGYFMISSMNGKYCSGSFSGTLKDGKGRSYLIRGKFGNIPVRNIEAGK